MRDPSSTLTLFAFSKMLPPACEPSVELKMTEEFRTLTVLELTNERSPPRASPEAMVARKPLSKVKIGAEITMSPPFPSTDALLRMPLKPETVTESVEIGRAHV